MAAKVALVALIISFLLAASPANSERRGFRATMIRRETAINFTRAARQSHERLSMLAARLDTAASRQSTQTPLRVDADGLGYDMEFSIGTPPLKLWAAADTGSDLIWTKCGTCASCAPQGSPSYYPDKSSSFSKLPCSDSLCSALQSESFVTCSAGGTECDYRYLYGLSTNSHHYTQGYMGSETFTLGSDVVPGVGFGCTTMSEGNYGTGSGLVGLGRGPLSLVSQLGVGAFSYCLTPDAKASPLLFGSLATLTGTGVQSTPLLIGIDTFYVVNLQSISIGAATTAGTGNNGIVFDSGTTLTFLADPAYSAAKTAILSQTALPRVANRGGYEACFQFSNGSSMTLPPMVLNFDGADMNLPTENFFQEVEHGVLCWIVQKSSSMSIIGNIMQMNYHIRYDVENSVLSFQPANCDSL
ncbi:aspartic proteinase nepenthesin-1-like [Phragmites australis]|uniref:aspartic proteinase nepenthesin-1-like n=1 Tax=Phragmites australis TaxID=29695 RepID=UPI002D76A73A|nr:aspartic proteinase nepenthesin-1-like [Phragmites australis]